MLIDGREWRLVPVTYIEAVEGAAKVASDYSPSIDAVDEAGGENADDPTWAIHHRLHHARFMLDTPPAATAAPSDEQLIALGREVARNPTEEQVRLYGHLWARLCRLALSRFGQAPAAMDADAWAELHILRAERGPADGSYATWKEAAVAERLRRVKAEQAPAASAEPVPGEIERLAVNRYRPVPAGVLAYKVVAGDGSRSLFSGTKDECQIVARKLTEAFLDGAHVAINAAPVAVQAPQAEPLHVTHGPLMRYAATLLRLRKPVTPDFERAAADLERAVDGQPTPAGEPSPEWLDVAQMAEQDHFRDAAKMVAAQAPHPDDVAVDRFAAAMKAKLAKKRAEGRAGWGNKEDCSQDRLSLMLRAHVAKGDPVDVANFAMMLHQRGDRISGRDEALPAANGDALAELHLLEEVCAAYADDEDRYLNGKGEPYCVAPEAGIKARAARRRFRDRAAMQRTTGSD